MSLDPNLALSWALLSYAEARLGKADPPGLAEVGLDEPRAVQIRCGAQSSKSATVA